MSHSFAIMYVHVCSSMYVCAIVPILKHTGLLNVCPDKIIECLSKTSNEEASAS